MMSEHNPPMFLPPAYPPSTYPGKGPKAGYGGKLPCTRYWSDNAGLVAWVKSGACVCGGAGCQNEFEIPTAMLVSYKSAVDGSGQCDLHLFTALSAKERNALRTPMPVVTFADGVYHRETVRKDILFALAQCIALAHSPESLEVLDRQAIMTNWGATHFTLDHELARVRALKQSVRQGPETR